MRDTNLHFGAYLQAVDPRSVSALRFLSLITKFQCAWTRVLILARCRFKVMDDERLSDDLAAWACYRLDRLQPGVRMLHLYNSNGVVSKGVLLVRIKKTVSLA